MERSKLKNKANKTQLPVDINNYRKQQNFVVNLNKSAKFEYFNRYDCKDDKAFWATCKPYFSYKHSMAVNDIIVIRKGKIVWKHGPYLAEFYYQLEISGVAGGALHQP